VAGADAGAACIRFAAFSLRISRVCLAEMLDLAGDDLV
jgi:hypothetical protein